MYRKIALTAIVFLSWSFNMSSAQESKRYTAQPEHEVLKLFEGEWAFERFSAAGDGSMPEKLGAGVISAGLLGDTFVVSKWSGTVYGIDYAAVQTLGYDIDKESYSGLWIDSLMNYQWQLDGYLAPHGKEFVLTAEGPAPGGGTGRFRERYQFESADAITIFAEMLRDEEWIPITTTHLARKEAAPETSREASE